MKGFVSRISAFIAVFISLLSFALVIGALAVAANEPEVTEGVSRSFGLWVYSMILAICAMVFYIIDLVVCIKKDIHKNNPDFQKTFSGIIVGGIPIALFVGGTLGMGILIWNLYHLAIVVLEIVSMNLHFKELRGYAGDA